MKITTRQRSAPALPGLSGTARVDRRTAHLLSRVRPGDLAVVDHQDMDRSTAQALVDAGVGAVLNAVADDLRALPQPRPGGAGRGRRRRGRHVRRRVLTAVKDGARVRLHEGTLYADDRQVAAGREVDLALVARASWSPPGWDCVPSWRASPTTAPSSSAVSRTSCCTAGACRAPPPTWPTGPSSWSCADTTGSRSSPGIKPFIKEQRPVLIGVDRGADALRAAGHQPDVVVASAAADELPSLEVLRKATDVVALVERGAARSATERLDRSGVRPLRFESGATAEDAALLLADTGRASLIVGRRHARDPGRVPRPTPHRPRQHLPDPPQGGPAARRRRRRPDVCTTAPCAPVTCSPSPWPASWPSVRPSA